MVNNKYQFIKDLLENKKINPKQRERILQLASKEISEEGALEERLQKIEDLIFNRENEVKGINSNFFNQDSEDYINKFKSENLTKSGKKHNPKKVNEWLKLFTLEKSPLKYTTHLWDEEGLFASFDDFIKRVEDEMIKYKIIELQKFNSDLYWNKIFPFIFQKKLTSIQKNEHDFGWGQHDIKIGWQYPDIIKAWCADHYDYKGKDAELPFSMQLPTELRPSKPILGKTIISFEDVINIFKREIEFRDNDLFVAVKGGLRKELNKHEINDHDLESLKGCSFYTNTEFVNKAIIRIFWMIKDRSESMKIQIKCNYLEDSKEYDFQVTHLNSFSYTELGHPKLMLKEETGNLFKLRKDLISLCNFSISSKFKDHENRFINARIHYLYDGVDQNNWEPKIEIIPEDINGFSFNLKFPVL